MSFSYSVIIATLDRPGPLSLTLRCLAQQTIAPREVLIAVPGDTGKTTALLASLDLPLPLRVISCPEKSSARQRNLAAAEATGEILAFLDDDIEFAADLFERALANFSDAATGAVAPRITNQDRGRPGRLTRLYLRLQAGYAHPNYGAQLFGVGINCFPIYADEPGDRIAAQWLPSTCLLVRAALFRPQQFPNFTGYSFAEDVHLTARLARESRIYFLREPTLLHHSGSSEFKADVAVLTAGKLHNMAVVAREVLGLRGWSLWWRWQFHRLFMTASLLTRRPPQWSAELRGVWRAHP